MFLITYSCLKLQLTSEEKNQGGGKEKKSKPAELAQVILNSRGSMYRIVSVYRVQTWMW